MHSYVRLLVAALIWAIHFSGAVWAQASQESADAAEYKKSIAAFLPVFDAGRFAEAARFLETAVHHAEHFPALDPRLPAVVHSLGFVYQQQARYPEAISQYSKAIHLWERIGPAHRDAMLQSLDNLISTYVESNDFRAAEKLIKLRLPELEQSAASWRDQAILLNMRAFLAHAGGRDAEAEAMFRRSLALWEQHVPGEEKNTAILLINLSEVLATTKRYRESLEGEVRALPVLEKLGPTGGPMVVRVLKHAAFLCVKMGDPDDAELYYRRALAEANRTFGPEHPVSGQIMLSYSTVLSALQRKSEAKLMADKAREVLRHSSHGQDTVDILALMPRVQ